MLGRQALRSTQPPDLSLFAPPFGRIHLSQGQPLEYWLWTPGDPMQSGIWDIQVPARRDVVTPDLVIAPLLGFDHHRYRLGNGGGYFSRTLAVRRDRPFVIGVGYAASELETIYPQPHDIAMNLILTERS